MTGICFPNELDATDYDREHVANLRQEILNTKNSEKKFELCTRLLNYDYPPRKLNKIDSIYQEVKAYVKDFSPDSLDLMEVYYALAIGKVDPQTSKRILSKQMAIQSVGGARAHLVYSGRMIGLNKLDSAIYFAMHAVDFYKSDLNRHGGNYGEASFYLFMAYLGLDNYENALAQMHEVRNYGAGQLKAHATSTMLRYAIRSNNINDELDIMKLVRDEHNNFNGVEIPAAFEFISDPKTIDNRILGIERFLTKNVVDATEKYSIFKHLAFLYFKSNKFDKSVEYEKKVLQSNKMATSRREVSSYEMLYHIYKFKLNNVDSALHYFEKLSAVRKENQDLALKESVAEWETKYKTAEKERGIILNTEKINETKDQQLGLVLGGLGLLSLGVLFYYLLRRRINRQRELSIQEEVIRKNEMERIRDERKVQILNASISGAEKERKRIAEQLNNEVGQRLRALQDNVNAIGRNYEPLVRELEAANTLIESSGSELNSIAQNIMPVQLIDGSLVDALQDFIRPYNATEKFEVKLKSEGTFESLPENLTLGVYRIIQELIKNSIKYANAKIIEIELIQSATKFLFSVQDNGSGFDVLQVKKGLGLSGAQSRVEHWGGTFRLTSDKVKGTRIELIIPQITNAEEAAVNRSVKD